MTDLGTLADARPFAASGLQEGFHFGVEIGRHGRILVKDCLRSKEHFTTQPSHPWPVAVKDINQVVAENLRHWMDRAELTQTVLAERAGVAQKTISNYLNPDQRTVGAKGKQGSPKLFELDLIAKALKVEVWQLTRQMTAQQRTAYEAIEKAYQELLAGAQADEQQTPQGQAALAEVEAAMQARSKPGHKREA